MLCPVLMLRLLVLDCFPSGTAHRYLYLLLIEWTADQRQRSLQTHEGAEYNLVYNKTPFSFSVSRPGAAKGPAIFDSSDQRLVFKV